MNIDVWLNQTEEKDETGSENSHSDESSMNTQMENEMDDEEEHHHAMHSDHSHGMFGRFYDRFWDSWGEMHAL